MTEPTADTTGGELREAVNDAHLVRLGRLADQLMRTGLDDDQVSAVLALPALRDLLTERDRLAAQVQAAREVHPRHRISDFDEPCAMCRALDTLP